MSIVLPVSDDWLRAYKRDGRAVGVVKPQRAVAAWRSGRYASMVTPWNALIKKVTLTSTDTWS